MHHTGEWVSVDPRKVDRPQPLEHDGVEVNVFFSPYDVPQAIRGHYDREAQRFIIEFRYIVPEKSQEETVGAITLRVGKKSRRLLGLEIAAEWPVSLTALTEAIEQALPEIERRREQTRDNYQVARDVLSRYGDKVLAST